MSLDNVRSNSSIALEKLRLIVREHRDDVEWQLPPERELALSLGLGRRAVRHAMEVLEAKGFVWRQQGKGTFVGCPALQPQFFGNLAERTNPSGVMEARLQIEPALARMARKTMAASDNDGWEL